MIDVSRYCASDKLEDGTPVIVRAISPGDSSSILDAFQDADKESIYTRFFAYKKELTATDLNSITRVDFANVVALVVVIQQAGGEHLAGGGRYYRNAAHKSAEIAFMTVDAYRGQGIASLILKHLATIAREQGIESFEADVLARNHAMMGVFGRSRLPIRTENDGATVHVSLSII